MALKTNFVKYEFYVAKIDFWAKYEDLNINIIIWSTDTETLLRKDVRIGVI